MGLKRWVYPKDGTHRPPQGVILPMGAAPILGAAKTRVLQLHLMEDMICDGETGSDHSDPLQGGNEIQEFCAVKLQGPPYNHFQPSMFGSECSTYKLVEYCDEPRKTKESLPRLEQRIQRGA